MAGAEGKRWYIHTLDLREGATELSAHVANTDELYVAARLRTKVGDVLVFIDEYPDGDPGEAEIGFTQFMNDAETEIRIKQLKFLWGLDDNAQVEADDLAEIARVMNESIALPAVSILALAQMLPSSN